MEHAFALACEAQTHFRSSLLLGSEATTGNASALRRLAFLGKRGKMEAKKGES